MYVWLMVNLSVKLFVNLCVTFAVHGDKRYFVVVCLHSLCSFILQAGTDIDSRCVERV